MNAILGNDWKTSVAGLCAGGITLLVGHLSAPHQAAFHAAVAFALLVLGRLASDAESAEGTTGGQ